MPDTGNAVILQIRNSKEPDQIISLVMSDSDAHFETRGLKELFGQEEIRVGRDDFLLAIHEWATLLSFLIETMSAAKDLRLPYAYMDNFEYKGRRYSLTRQNGYRVLKKEEGG